MGQLKADAVKLRRLLVEFLGVGSSYDLVWPLDVSANWDQHLDLYDSLAVELAKLFDNGEWSFDQADNVANKLWGHMVTHLPKGDHRAASDLCDVYDAFDAGEGGILAQGRGAVAKFTAPAIKRFLAALEN